MANYRLIRPIINGQKTQVWYVVWSQGRRTARQSTRTTDKVEAQSFLRKMEAMAALPPETFSVADLCNAYQKEREESGRVAYPKSIANSLNHIRAYFGGLPPSLISRATVTGYLTQRRKAGVMDSTIDKELRFLRQALKFGVREGWIEKEPKFVAPGAGAPRERFLTREEFALIYFRASVLHLRTYLALSIDTLARGKHVLALTWDQIDFDRRIVWYPKPKAGSRKKTQPAPMTDRLEGVLRLAFKARQSRYVIEWNGRSVKSVRKAYETACRLAALSDAHRHDLRRSGASWAVQDGQTFDAVATLLGDSVEITQKHYAHFSPSYLQGVVDSIANGKGGRRA